MRRLAGLLLAAIFVVSWAAAVEAAGSSGRIVLQGAADLRSRLVQTGSTLLLPIGKHAVHVVVPHVPVHDVVHVVRKSGVITIEIKPGAVVQLSSNKGALVIDVSDPPKQAQPVSAAVKAGTAAHATTPVPGDALIPGLPDSMVASVIGLRPAAKPTDPKPGLNAKAPASPPAQRTPTGAAASASAMSRPLSLSPTPAVTASSGDPGATGCLFLSSGRAAGVAMYHRGAATIVIVDRSLAPSGSDGDWWQAHKPQVTQTSEWTALRIPTPGREGIRIERQSDGLCLMGTPTVPPLDNTIAYEAQSSGLSFVLPRPGRALVVVDPETHALLLVGTDGGGAGALRPMRRSALFGIDETMAGIVIEPLSDRLGLHRTSDGFALTIDGAASIHVPSGFADTSIASVDGLTRTLSLAAEPTDTLVHLLQRRMLEAATAPLRARSDRRLDLAEAMVALGLGAEARSVLDVAASDDPAEAASPRAALLAAIAALLDRPRHGPDPFAAAGFPTTEEGKLWRALAWAPPAPPGPAAVTIRRGMPLLLSYPARLRDAAATAAARVLLAGDDPDALRAVDLLPDSEAIRLARARASARLGHQAEALASLDRLARSRNFGVMADALREGVRLRLAAGQIAPATAADLLDAHRLDWRVSGQEASALLEEADDRLRVPDLRAAFVLWRDALAVAPSLRDTVEARRLVALNQLATRSVADKMSASDYASTIAENADAIPEGSDLAARTGVLLADKFAALGLDDHAAATLEKLVGAMPPGIARATINTQLAALDVSRGDAGAAGTALARDDDATITAPTLASRRRLVRARMLDAQGKPAEALALLASATGDEELRLQAKLLMERQDWHAALTPLGELFHRLPAHGALDAAQGAVALQLVAASVRDGTPASSTAAKDIEPRLADQSERRSLAVLMAPLAAPVTPTNAAGEKGI